MQENTGPERSGPRPRDTFDEGFGEISGVTDPQGIRRCVRKAADDVRLVGNNARPERLEERGPFLGAVKEEELWLLLDWLFCHCLALVIVAGNGIVWIHAVPLTAELLPILLLLNQLNDFVRNF